MSSNRVAKVTTWVAAVGVAAVAVALMGCAGPSKARLKVLLHECRDSNRERLRMLREYENMNCSSHPEQTAGSLEMGLGGF